MPMSMAPSGPGIQESVRSSSHLLNCFFFFLKIIKNYILNYSWIYKFSYYNLGFKSKMNVREKTRFVVNISVIVYTTRVTRILPWAELILLQCKHGCLDASSVLKKNYSSSNFTVSNKIILFNYMIKKNKLTNFFFKWLQPEENIAYQKGEKKTTKLKCKIT
jgi:hypothetical protein